VGSVLVFYVWTTLISTSFLLVFFYPGWLVSIYFLAGMFACLLLTVWPLIARRTKIVKK
jgi:hypothetical protein